MQHHPKSTADAETGMGDASWLFNLSKVVPPPCEMEENEDEHNHEYDRREHQKRKVKTCSKNDDTNFIKQLKKLANNPE